MKNSWLNKNIFGFSLASFFNDFCHEMTTAILPAFIEYIIEPTYAPLALGMIQGVADAASTVMKLISGWLADTVSFYKPFLIVGYGLTSIVALIGTTHSTLLILIYKTIAWIGRGIREPMRDTWIAKIVSPQFYGRTFGFHRAWDTLGALMGPLCAFILLKMDFSLPSIFFISFIPGILSMLPIIFLTHETKEQTQKIEHIKFKEQIKKLPSNFNYFLLVMFIFGIANFNQALLIYRVQELLSGTATSSVVATGWAIAFYTFFNLIRGISEFGIGTLSDFTNRKNLLAIFGFGAFGITSIGFMIQTTQIWFWFLIFALAGLSAGTVKSLEKSHAATLLPELIRGTGMGVLQSIDGVGDLISSVVVGGLWSIFSPFIGILYAVILSFIAMFMLILKK